MSRQRGLPGLGLRRHMPLLPGATEAAEDKCQEPPWWPTTSPHRGLATPNGAVRTQVGAEWGCSPDRHLHPRRPVCGYRVEGPSSHGSSDLRPRVPASNPALWGRHLGEGCCISWGQQGSWGIPLAFLCLCCNWESVSQPSHPGTDTTQACKPRRWPECSRGRNEQTL